MSLFVFVVGVMVIAIGWRMLWETWDVSPAPVMCTTVGMLFMTIGCCTSLFGVGMAIGRNK